MNLTQEQLAELLRDAERAHAEYERELKRGAPRATGTDAREGL